jgi:hypothetical protein
MSVQHALAERGGQFQIPPLHAAGLGRFNWSSATEVATGRLPLYDALSIRRRPFAEFDS